MEVIKPLQNSKPKRPLYYKEVVQMYDLIQIKGKAAFNPVDALDALQRQLENKKAIKTTLLAEEEVLKFKKKGIGKSPKLKKVPYSSVKSFYQFASSPAFVVLGVHGREIPKQYVILATPSVDKANKFTEILQAAQWAPKNNLKNQVTAAAPSPVPSYRNSTTVIEERPNDPSPTTPSPTIRERSPSPVTISERVQRSYVDVAPLTQRTPQSTPQSVHRSSITSIDTSPAGLISCSTCDNRGRSRNLTRTYTSHHSQSPSPLASRTSRRSPSVASAVTLRNSPSRKSTSPEFIIKRNKFVSTGYTDEHTYYVFYEPEQEPKERRHRSRRTDKPIIAPTTNRSSSLGKKNRLSRQHSVRDPYQSGVYIVTENKEDAIRAKKAAAKRPVSEGARLSEKIYYIGNDDTSRSSSSSSSISSSNSSGFDSEYDQYVGMQNGNSSKSSFQHSNGLSQKSNKSKGRSVWSVNPSSSRSGRNRSSKQSAHRSMRPSSSSSSSSSSYSSHASSAAGPVKMKTRSRSSSSSSSSSSSTSMPSMEKRYGKKNSKIINVPIIYTKAK